MIQRTLQLLSNVAFFGAGKDQPAAVQVLFAILFHLILTNIMIALALNTNERLKFNRKAIDYKLKVQFILFVEHLLSNLKPPTSSTSRHYLHILRYTQVDHESTSWDWDGTDRSLLFKQDRAVAEARETTRHVATLNDDLKREAESIRAEMRRLIEEEVVAEVRAAARRAIAAGGGGGDDGGAGGLRAGIAGGLGQGMGIGGAGHGGGAGGAGEALQL